MFGQKQRGKIFVQGCIQSSSHYFSSFLKPQKCGKNPDIIQRGRVGNYIKKFNVDGRG
jgi:hypothetical protein